MKALLEDPKNQNKNPGIFIPSESFARAGIVKQTRKQSADLAEQNEKKLIRYGLISGAIIMVLNMAIYFSIF